MKRFLVITLFAVLALSAVGCRKKMEEKLSESILESFLGESEGLDVDIEGEKVVIKGEDGSEVTYGSTEWPSSKLAKNVPVFKNGVITGTVDSEEYSTVYMEEVKEKDALEYLKEIKEKFTLESYEINSNDLVTYSGKNEDNISVLIYYDTASESLSISISKEAE